MIHHPTDPPSSIGLSAACPGCRALRQKAVAQGLAVNPYAEEAEEGTDLHVLARPGVPLDGVKPELAELALKARAYGEHHAAGAEWVAYEQHLTVWHANGAGVVTWGTTDWMAKFPGLVRLIDFKFHWAETVEPLVLWQMRCYAEGALQMHRVERVEVFVFNPRSGEELRGQFTFGEFIPGQIEELIEAAEKSPEDYRPGAWCRYCAAKGICPAFTEEALAVAKRGPELPADPAELNRVLDICTAVEALGPALRKRLVEMIRAGELAIPGREMRTVATREITDLPGLLGILAEVGCTQEDWLRHLKASLPGLEAVYKTAVLRLTNGLSETAKTELSFEKQAAPFLKVGERYELRKAKGGT